MVNIRKYHYIIRNSKIVSEKWFPDQQLTLPELLQQLDYSPIYRNFYVNKQLYTEASVGEFMKLLGNEMHKIMKKKGDDV